MTEAVRLMCIFVFENTDIIRIFAEPYAFNAASCRVLEKAGFAFEGVLRQNAIKNGKIIDMKLYSLLKTDVELAHSLSANTTELIPYLPYILQDYWELGSDPDVMVRLIEKYVGLQSGAQILDLACGKGAVSVRVAERLGARVKGVDITPEFIEYARQKAKEYGAENLCEFTLGDINETVKVERGYDCVILGAVGPGVLGGPAQTLQNLKTVVKSGGYILIEDGFIADEESREKIRHNKDIHLTERQWLELFEDAGLTLCETASGFGEGEMDNVSGMAAITKRANELIKKHPDKKALLEGYVHSQQNEYDDINDGLICVTWVLQKR
jgi:SAM-dependent methyltransferase